MNCPDRLKTFEAVGELLFRPVINPRAIGLRPMNGAYLPAHNVTNFFTAFGLRGII